MNSCIVGHRNDFRNPHYLKLSNLNYASLIFIFFPMKVLKIRIELNARNNLLRFKILLKPGRAE